MYNKVRYEIIMIKNSNSKVIIVTTVKPYSYARKNIGKATKGLAGFRRRFMNLFSHARKTYEKPFT